MIVVLSQTTAIDNRNADEYVRKTAAFLPFMRESPGFHGRMVLRSLDVPMHFIHYRMFDAVADYEALTERPGYMENVYGTGRHTTVPKHREYFQLVVNDLPTG